MRRNKNTYRPALFALGLALTFSASGMARAQDGDTYAVGDEGTRPIQNNPADQPTENEPTDANAPAQGPVRLARFSYIEGNVTWREDENSAWTDAGINLPVRQGAQISVAAHGRAEIQFDDGSLLRLGGGALVTLQTLYSDAEGEYSEIKLTEGLSSLRTRNSRSVYQIDTPLISVKTSGPSKLRVGAGASVEAAVMQGDATVEGSQGRADLHRGDYLSLDDPDAAFAIRSLPRADGWERWNEQRDASLEEAADRPARQHLPPNIAIVAPDLDAYGTWRDDPEYGYVWCPRVVEAEWRPYNAGRWTWVQPFGWTWVSSEAWGWAPYHYGTWCHRNYGWAWCPGPVTQYWSPAVVHFSEYNGGVAWCPLAPHEVRYPAALSIGFHGGNWAACFSIGQAGVYYATGDRYCEGRPWNSNYVNHITRINNVTNINVTNIYNNNNYVVNHNVIRNLHFTPVNAQSADGASSASLAAFGGRGAYRTVSRSEATVFTEGRAVTAPQPGLRPVAGPVGARPSALSTSSTRTLTPGGVPSDAAANRRVFRAPAPPSVQNSGTTPLPGRARQTNPNGGYAGRDAATRRIPGDYGAASFRAATPGGYTGRAGGARTGGNAGTARSGVAGGNAGNPGGGGQNGYPGRSGRTPRRDNLGGGTNGGNAATAPTLGRRRQPTDAPRSSGGGAGTTSGGEAADRARAARQSLGMGRNYGGPNGTYRQDPSAGKSGDNTPSAPRVGYGRSTDSTNSGGRDAGRGGDAGRTTTRRDTYIPRRTEPNRSDPPARSYAPPTRADAPPVRRDAPRPEPTRRDAPRAEPRQERRPEPGRSAPAPRDSGGSGGSKGSSGGSGGSQTGRRR